MKEEILKEFEKLESHKFEPSSAKEFCQRCGEYEEDHYPLGEKVRQLLLKAIDKAKQKGRDEREKELTDNALNRHNPNYLPKTK